MSLAIEPADAFDKDFEVQGRWYTRNATETVAQGYLAALQATITLLSNQPDIGRRRRFRHPKLRGLRSAALKRPFHKHLLFYRYDAETLYLERVMHGARDLSVRLLEPPD